MNDVARQPSANARLSHAEDLLPIVWKGGRRVDSWTVGRKVRFTITTLLFVTFTILIGFWGGLTAWVS